VRVVGLADSSLLDKADPKNPLNRRISIIVMNKIAEERMNQAGGEIEAGHLDEVKEALPSEPRAEAAPAAEPSTPVAAAEQTAPATATQ
jgi:chemotaxis protein MotB